MKAKKSSELIINKDGTIFHLHLRPEELAERVILVGDPQRVEMIAAHMKKIEVKRQNREFHAVTGRYFKTRMTVLSTGIGTDNIDIVMNELDALANFDFDKQEPYPMQRTLEIVRIGTSGSVQADVPVGSYVLSERCIGLDGVLRYYKHHERACDREFEDAFIEQCQWAPMAARPYVVRSSTALMERLHIPHKTIRGVTLTANGFYGPQGRAIRLALEMPEMNNMIARFQYKDQRIINYEMESAAIAGLATLMGHRAATICLIIANRATGEAMPDYHMQMEQLVRHVLNTLTD